MAGKSMRGYAIYRPATAFTRLGRSRRRSRQRSDQHLKWLRTLPCVICGARGNIHAAHLRAASPRHGKLAVGIGQRPDDCWATPLCLHHHLFGVEAQHEDNELAFWARHCIDPFALALALWQASGDDELEFAIPVPKRASSPASRNNETHTTCERKSRLKTASAPALTAREDAQPGLLRECYRTCPPWESGFDRMNWSRFRGKSVHLIQAPRHSDPRRFYQAWPRGSGILCLRYMNALLNDRVLPFYEEHGVPLLLRV